MVAPVETTDLFSATRERYRSRFPHLGADFISAVEDEFKVWCGLHRLEQIEKNPIWITTELLWLDEFWHDCLLEPEEYARACREIVGKPLEHVVFNKHTDAPLSRERFQEQLRVLGGLIGPEKLRKWYVEYPKQFQKPAS